MDREFPGESCSDSVPARTLAGYLTSPDDFTGGVLKAEPEDFVVEEIPAYVPSGEGEHLFLWVEKRDVAAEDLIVRLSRALNIPRGDVGSAGLKDRRAITRQWLSVPARCEPHVPGLELEGIKVLSFARHANKLRTAHLKGNRFEIRLRDVLESAAPSAAAIAAELRSSGVLNLYGDQRFGIDNRTLELGFALLRGEKSRKSIPYTKRRFLQKLALSSVQSAVFNEILAERLKRGTIGAVQAGDVMQVVATGGLFVAEDVSVEQKRCDARETVITGPMFGPCMKRPTGAVAELESEILARWGLDFTAFERFPAFTSGTRRPYLAAVDDLETVLDGNSLFLRFSLPAGVYATSVTREFQKENRGFPAGL